MGRQPLKWEDAVFLVTVHYIKRPGPQIQEDHRPFDEGRQEVGAMTVKALATNLGTSPGSSIFFVYDFQVYHILRGGGSTFNYTVLN
jgi:hypothetical protein